MRVLWAVGASVAIAGCASASGSVPRPFPTAGRGPSRGAPASVSADPAPSGETRLVDTYALVGTALELRGAPYLNGGSDPFGFDCSGFTQYVFAQHHIALPRDVRDQFRAGRAVATADLAPGDLVFFATTDRAASHVAIMVGADEFVHAPSSNGVVRVERISSSYWAPRYLGARRVTLP
jgi:cell wall-associated NlpC family hydrolase